MKAWSGEAGQIAQVVVEDTTGRVTEAWTGPAGRVEDGARTRGRVRREDAPEARTSGSRSASSSSSASPICAGRSRCGTSTCSRCSASRSRSRSSTAGRSSAASRSSIRCSRTCSPAGSGSASAGAAGRSRPSGRRGCSPPRRSSSSGSASGSTSRRRAASSTSGSRASSARAGSSTARRRTGTCRSAATSSRAGRRTRRGRCASASRRTGAARPRSSAATRTAPSRTSPTCPRSAIFGWSGKWDSLPAAHATSIAFDLLAVLALVLVGLRFGGRRLAVAARVRVGRVPVHGVHARTRTRTTRSCPRSSLVGFWLVTSDWARGASVALAGWTKFGALLVAPLWATYPTLELRRVLRFAAAFVGATVARLLDPAARAVALGRGPRRSGIGRSGSRPGATRRSRSGAGASTTREGIPDLGFLQPVVVVARRRARRRSSRSSRGARARSSSPR